MSRTCRHWQTLPRGVVSTTCAFSKNHEEGKTLGGCRTGEAKITRGYKLPAKYVIHTVGPIYGREHGKEAELLAGCYKNSLRLAVEHNIKTIADYLTLAFISGNLHSFPNS